MPIKVLNVAEKPDAAKRISSLLAHNGTNRREGKSVYNKIYEFQINIPNFGNCDMMMTSVSGHMKESDFTGDFRKWRGCRPNDLFERAPVIKQVAKGKIRLAQTLRDEGKKCQLLIIWTDCDREGENIGYEIIEEVRKVKEFGRKKGFGLAGSV